MELTKQEEKLIKILRKSRDVGVDTYLTIHLTPVEDTHIEIIGKCEPANILTVKKTALPLMDDLKKGLNKRTLFLLHYEDGIMELLESHAI